MTGGQWRVLIILGILLGVDVATSQTTRDSLKTLASGKGLANPDILKAAAAYGLGAGALILIAGWQEGFATGLALVLLALALINKSDQIAPAVQGAANAINSLKSGGSGSK